AANISPTPSDSDDRALAEKVSPQSIFQKRANRPVRHIFRRTLISYIYGDIIRFASPGAHFPPQSEMNGASTTCASVNLRRRETTPSRTNRRFHGRQAVLRGAHQPRQDQPAREARVGAEYPPHRRKAARQRRGI